MSNTVITASMQINNTAGLDDYLTVRPKEMLDGNSVSAPNYASLFSYNYKRITPFAKHTVYIPFNEKVDFGRTITAVIPYLGDLLHTVHLYFRLPQLSPPPPGSNYIGWVNCIGYAMIETVQIRIGETIFDEHDGLFMEIMDYITVPSNKTEARNKSVGRYDNTNVLAINANGEQDIYIPLHMWFTKKMFSALPMTSLSGQTVRIHVKLKNFQDLVTYDGDISPVEMPIQESGVMLDYYLLSEPEKNLFKTEVQEYLIEQWQHLTFEIPAGISTSRFSLDFTKCVKEIVFVLTETESENNNDYFNFGRRDERYQGGELISHIGLAFDGKIREEKLPESFYRIITPQRYHTVGGNRNIYVISFSENPEINQPTGTVNFSRYDNIELLLDFIDNVPQCRLHVLAIVYNKINIDPNDGIQIEFVN